MKIVVVIQKFYKILNNHNKNGNLMWATFIILRQIAASRLHYEINLYSGFIPLRTKKNKRNVRLWTSCKCKSANLGCGGQHLMFYKLPSYHFLPQIFTISHAFRWGQHPRFPILYLWPVPSWTFPGSKICCWSACCFGSSEVWAGWQLLKLFLYPLRTKL